MIAKHRPSLSLIASALFILLIGALLFLPSQSVSAATLPNGFTETNVATGMTSPTAMSIAPDGRIFVCQQGGQLRVVKNGSLLGTPFVTLTVDSSGERGLLGVAFDPNFAANQFVYVYYTVPGSPAHNRVSRLTANGDVALAGSEVPILDLNNLSATNHNGGAIHFGPDGKLYVAVGENANTANSQTLNNLLGKVLRINTDGTVPADNPFFNQATGVNRAIWALGLRNPFTFNFQPGTGRMFINDVGQSAREEVNDGIAGSNYGWPTCEGPCNPGNANFRDPVYDYTHAAGNTQGCAIVGAAFYNPSVMQFPASFAGKYFFTDLCGSWINYIDPNNPSASNSASVFATGLSTPVDLLVSPEGSLYYLQLGNGGQLWRIDYEAQSEPLQYYPLLNPIRLLDTRPGFAACDAPGVPLGNNAVMTQPTVGGCSGIPANAKAIVGNATVVNFISAGFHWITLYPSDAALPNASNLNFSDNQIVPNQFTVRLGADGAFKIYSHAVTHFIVDITGYYAPPGAGGLYFHPLPAPKRLLDTRVGFSACDAPGVPLGNDAIRAEQATVACTGIPATAKAIAGNATVVNFISTGSHWITLYPFGATLPNASNLNFTANQIVPNAFVTGLSNDGKFNIYSHAATDFIVDVTGYFSSEAVDANGAGLFYNPLPAPVRLLDTRPGFMACDAPGLPLGNDAVRAEQATVACSGVPAAAQAIVGNATVVNFNSTGFHWITLYPFGAALPNASNLNFNENHIVPNAFVSGLSNDGKFNIYSHASTHFIVDLSGYFAP